MRSDVDDRDLSARLGRELADIAAEAPGGMGARAQRRLRQRRMTRAIAVVLLVGAAGGAIAAWRHEQDDRASRVATDPGESMAPTTVVHTIAPYVSPTTSTTPVATDGSNPVEGRGQVSMLWTGEELVVWGGTADNVVHRVDGGRYDPATQTWRAVPPAPIRAQEGQRAAVAGGRLFVCCGGTDGTDAPVAAVFDLATDEWRATSAPPVALTYPRLLGLGDAVAVTDGSQLLLYEPERDAWQRLADPPEGMRSPRLATDGERIYAWSTPSGGSLGNFGAVYELATDEWAAIPEPPAGAFPTWTDVVWTDAGLAVWGIDHGSFAYPGPGDVAVGALWRPADGTWHPMPQLFPAAPPSEGNAGSQSTAWGGGRLFVATGALAGAIEPRHALLLAYDPRTDSWERLPVAVAARYGAEMVAMGDHGLALMDAGRFVVVPLDQRGEPMIEREPVRQSEHELVWWLRYHVALGANFERVRWADRVRIVAGEESVERFEDELFVRDGWLVGTVDVAGPLRPLQQPDDVRVEAGDAPLPCAPRPSPLQDGRRLTLTPARAGGCGDDWFAIELYLDDGGALAAVRLVNPD